MHASRKVSQGGRSRQRRNITVRKVSDFKDMMAAGVLFTPAVAIDGIVKASGRVPCKDEIEAWIDEAAGN